MWHTASGPQIDKCSPRDPALASFDEQFQFDLSHRRQELCYPFASSIDIFGVYSHFRMNQACFDLFQVVRFLSDVLNFVDFDVTTMQQADGCLAARSSL